MLTDILPLVANLSLTLSTLYFTPESTPLISSLLSQLLFPNYIAPLLSTLTTHSPTISSNQQLLSDPILWAHASTQTTNIVEHISLPPYDLLYNRPIPQLHPSFSCNDISLSWDYNTHGQMSSDSHSLASDSTDYMPLPHRLSSTALMNLTGETPAGASMQTLSMAIEEEPPSFLAQNNMNTISPANSLMEEHFQPRLSSTDTTQNESLTNSMQNPKSDNLTPTPNPTLPRPN